MAHRQLVRMILELIVTAFKRFIWNPLIAPFRNEIVVDTRLAAFSFSTNGASFQLPTYVYLSVDRPYRVLAVGQDYLGGGAVSRLIFSSTGRRTLRSQIRGSSSMRSSPMPS